jgi:EAL domain-containing protein (putative c-di-GMP-specific phosphodiesterase class I)
LRELGVRLALDGFGSAAPAGSAASLTALRDAPLHTLKLSRALLQGTPEDERRTLFAGAVIGLAKRLGLRLVAEGVEGPEQLQMLKAEGCDAVQSFIGCPPLPAEACTDWLRQATQRP